MRLKQKLFLTLSMGGLFISSPAFSVPLLPSLADLAEELQPSVVNISTTHDKNEIGDEARDIDSHIETNVMSIFNAPKTNKISLGSGFIIDKQGFIITNNHVIDKAQTISVVLSDDSIVEAKVVGRDAKTDIALIKINTNKPLKPVKFGNSDKIRVGDWIMAIGNPFGLGGSVTVGIVSAKSRDIESGPYDSFIQTDASINQGSSGGPMFNLDGEVIGINTAIFSTNGGSMGIGFAIPINLAEFVMKQLKTHGAVKRGWLGIKMQPNSIDIAQSVGLRDNQGVIISTVTENSTAAKAGLQAGDIILKFDYNKIDNTKNLSRMVAETPIGKTIDIDIWRAGAPLKLKVLIEEMPSEPKAPTPKIASNLLPSPKNDELNDAAPLQEPLQENITEPQKLSRAPNYNLGLKVMEITPEIINRYSLNPNDKGVVIIEVIPNSDAYDKGLKAGNLITQIDKKTVLDRLDVQAYVNEAVLENKRPVLLQIKDGEQPHFVAIKLMEAEAIEMPEGAK